MHTAIMQEMTWSEQQDWTGTTAETRTKLEGKKAVEIYKSLCEKYGLK